MTVLTGCGAIISAAHRGENGILHGHTWEVTAWFKEGDALVLQKSLQSLISQELDHRELDFWQGRGEWMAEYIGTALSCVRVDISRPLERIYARWEL